MAKEKAKNNLNMQLKQKTESLTRSRVKDDLTPNTEIDRLLHELEAHQIAIKLQNEQLKAVQIELEIARDRYRDLYDFAPVAYFTLNKDNRIIEVNFTASSLLNEARSSLINSRFTRFIVDNESDTFYFFKKQVIKNKGKHTCHLRMKTAEGNFFYAHLEGLATAIEGQINLSVIDITQRKDKESKLHCCLYDSGMIGVIYYNMDGQITDANNKFLKMVGYTREDLEAGRINWVHMTPPEYNLADERAIAEMRAHGIVGAPYEKEYIRKDGSRVPIIIGGASYDDTSYDGIAFVLDITRHKKAEQELKRHEEQLGWLVEERTAELKQSEENFRNSIDSSPLGIRIATENEETLYANKALLNMFGYDSIDRFEIAKHYTKECYAEYLVRKNQRRLGFILPDPYEIAIVGMDGEERQLLVHRRKVRWENKMEYQLIYEDITEQKRTMDSLKALSHKLITVQEEERRMIARELHDQIGQSLNVINLLLKRSSGSTKKNTGSLIVQAQDQISELMTLVSNLCLNLRPPMLDDLGLIDTLIWYMDRFEATTGIQVAFKHYGLDRKIDTTIAVTAFRIIQEALINVARHASVDNATLNIWTDENMLHLEVEDNGTGFNLSDLPAEAVVGITGMRERAELVCGNLEIISDPDTGTRIIAEIPLVEINNEQ